MINLTVSKKTPSTVVLLVAEYVKEKLQLSVQFGNSNLLVTDTGVNFTTTAAVCRYLARVTPQLNLYGSTVLQKTEVDHWLKFSSSQLGCASRSQADALAYLNEVIAPVTLLVGHTITLADISVWAALSGSDTFQKQLKGGSAPPNVARYYKHLASLKPFRNVSEKLCAEPAPKQEKERKKEGKFVELEGAEMGKVVVRFPPEASGYLHIGHAKAALLNQYYQQTFKGKLVMRFDDTNPAKETEHYETVILADLDLLGIKPDVFTHTSDHFERLLGLCTQLITAGRAYVDNTAPDVMKEEREARVPSSCRAHSVEENLRRWRGMQASTDPQFTGSCVRAKMDMASDNGCMRDPTIYRCKSEPHLHTGTKYKVYPTYDFACPVVDSVEGVTHALRTTEYHDRDEQYNWFLKALDLRKVYIWEYSRLNLQHTVMSKRKLTWFVNEGLVDGWDDPRFPTVRGVLRRGMTVEGLKEFVIGQGSSRSVVMMEWDKIWAINKKVIDPRVARYTALVAASVVPVTVTGATDETKPVQKHPKNAAVGTKLVRYGGSAFIDGADAATLSVGEVVTFINWGNLVITKIHRSADKGGGVQSVEATLDLQNTDYKKTQKLTWLAAPDVSSFVPVRAVTYEPIISKAILTKDDDFKDYVNTNTKTEVSMLGDPELAGLRQGDIIQLQRRGFYICDSAYEQPSRHSGRASPCILIHIPDGHTKEMPSAGSKHKDLSSAKERAQTKKGKVAEKSPQDEQPPSKVGSKVGSKVTAAAAAVDPQTLSQQIVDHGNKIRDMKENKAPKEQVGHEVNILLSLKKSYESLTGAAWKSSTAWNAPPPGPTGGAPGGAEGKGSEVTGGAGLRAGVDAQGLIVRQLKAAGAPKHEVDAAVKTLLALKVEYTKVTGEDLSGGGGGKRGRKTAAPPGGQGAAEVGGVKMEEGGGAAAGLKADIDAQGAVVRDLKAAGGAKVKVDVAVKRLLQLKAEYKELTGEDLAGGGGKRGKKGGSKPPPAQPATKPATQPAQPAQPAAAPGAEDLKGRIDAQGVKVRGLKEGGATKDVLDVEIKQLLKLKQEYKELTGQDLAGGGGKRGKKGGGGDAANKGDGGKAADGRKKPADANRAKQEQNQAASGREVKKVTRLGLECKKEENLSDWYSQVITKGEMIEYHDVSGCYVLRPWAFSIWEAISRWFDAKIKQRGFQNCYFPMFVSQAALEREKEHIADFAPEVAWVTRSGDTELAEPIAIRPTSETVMYPSYSKWVQSHRDLPIKLNQWCNVVRWEFKHPQPFLRTREFLWQEGHSAYANVKDATDEVHDILGLYAEIYESLLAIPVISGRKTEKEKFAGGDFTTTVEVYIAASGRAIQAATSHHLGQNFARMFDISFEDPETREKQYAYQNSWGITTRSIGIVVMVHGDNRGLVLPPRIACVQAVIIPCGVTASLGADDLKALMTRCDEVYQTLADAKILVKLDARDNYSPGWKFNYWELKGVPLRIEVGPRDVALSQVVAVRRDSGDKAVVGLGELVERARGLLDDIHSSMFSKAKRELDDSLVVCTTFGDFCSALDTKKIIMAPFCEDVACEEAIKELSARDAVVEEGAPAMGAKSLCIPFKQPRPLTDTDVCVRPDCDKPPRSFTLFGRSY